MNVKQTIRATIKFIKLIQKDQKGILFILLAGSFFTALSPFVSLVYSTKILNLVYIGKQKECIPYLVIMLVLNLVLGLIAKACAEILEVLKKSSYYTVERNTAYKAFTMNYEEYEKPETLDAIRRVKQGEQVGGGVGDQLSNLERLLEQVWTIVFSLFFVIHLFQMVDYNENDFFSSYTAAILFLLLYGGIVTFTFCLARNSNKKSIKMRKSNEHNNSVAHYVLSLSQDLKNGKDVRLYGMRHLILHCYDFYFDKYSKMYLKWGKINGMLGGVMIFISQIPALLSYIFIIAQAKNNVIQVGDILLYAGAINRLTQSVEQAIVSFNSYAYKMDYLKMYQEFIEKPEKEEGTSCLKEPLTDWEFTFCNVSFSYPGTDEEVLHNINMTIKKGERIAIVGENGAGKTTVIKLLCRFYEPSRGTILLNGTDIKTWKREEYMKLFSAVFQDFKLFSFPLSENIAGGTEIVEEKAWEALKKSGMKEMVFNMPDQLNTRLYRQNGEGVEISGGQAQKLAIARALYKNRPVVILDEPTSALDPFSEAEIYEKFHEVVENKTAIYISHRMSSCKFCERILVFKHGEIVQEGNHDALLAQKGLYADLYNTQAAYYVQ